MKAKTKIQKQIIAIDKKVPKLSEKQKQWAKKTCHSYYAFRNNAGTITCMICNHKWKSVTTQGWQDEIMTQKCPNCKSQLKIRSTPYRTYNEEKTFCIVTTIQNHQLIRIFTMNSYFKTSEKPRSYIAEQSRVYINEKGKFVIVGYSRANGWYGSSRWFGDWSVKHNDTIYAHNQHWDYYYPTMRWLPIVKRNGLKKYTKILTPFDTAFLLIKEPKAETLYKANQMELFTTCVYPERLLLIKKYWNTLKILIRRKVFISNAKDYLDYLELLEFFGKDLQCDKYICPDDFHKAHQHYVKKKRVYIVKQKEKERLEQMLLENDKYVSHIQKFKDLELKEKNITIKVIDSVFEIERLGNLFHHCIHTNDYHKKKNSLLLCGYHKDKPMETIEFNLNKFTIIQSRGLQNKASKYNKKIIETLNNNITMIKKLSKRKTNVKQLKSA